MPFLTALIVDDDSDFRNALGEVLSDEGYRVLKASNGHEAMAILDSLIPDVILIDLIMPEMNGWALFAIVDARPELKTVPVVFLSGVPHMAPGYPRGRASPIGDPPPLAGRHSKFDSSGGRREGPPS